MDNNTQQPQEPTMQETDSLLNPSETQEEAESAPVRKAGSDTLELVKAMIFASVIALGVRSFLFEPFNIPSGSMLPTLLVGDYLFVEKYAYGYSKYSFPLDLINFDGRLLGRAPHRGDIAVFRQPKKVGIDYIKRLVGLPGDRIRMTAGRLYINDILVPRDFKGTEDFKDGEADHLYQRYTETLPNGVEHTIFEMSDRAQLDDTEEFIVPEGYYFAMGDNRDGSLDSRAQNEVGFIPEENLIGRASFLFFSTEGIGTTCNKEGFLAGARATFCKLVEWPKAVRYSRIFSRVHNLR